MRKFIHLRYLNLSGNKRLNELPEVICDLFNLQTLKVDRCGDIKLPGGIGRLVNLRHLHCRGTDIRDMPKGIGKLSALRTLDYFQVTKPHCKDGCKLEDLKDLNHLRGMLSIIALQYVSNVREAEVACLKHKKHLRSLTLQFDSVDMGTSYFDRGDKAVMRTFDKNLLDALQPHEDLEYLEIAVYSGIGLFPNWILSLTKLKLLSLSNCESLEQLPPLGKLPNLEYFKIYYAESMKKVGIEFLGSEEFEGQTSQSSLVLFPKLKHLSFDTLVNWEEWEGLPTEGEIAVMPSLCSLSFDCCPKLKALTQFLHIAPLQRLSITHCTALTQRYERETGEDWPKISHIPNIIISLY